MNLYQSLQERDAARRPVRVGLIGAGKFGTMFLAQVPRLPGLHVVAIADLQLARARAALRRAGWSEERLAPSYSAAQSSGRTFLTEDAAELIAGEGLEVVIEATGQPQAGIRHALLCAQQRRHVIMVNVEADALAGNVLARRAAEAGVVYSLAYGDQPSLISELVDWARSSGFSVVCAGKGTKYLPDYHIVTPDTVWSHYGFTAAQIAADDLNARMFTSFLDGTKSAIEMAAVANATGLNPPNVGLQFPPAGIDNLAQVCRPRAAGGQLERAGTVEVVSSLWRDGRPVVRDLRWGVYVTFEAGSAYVQECFAQYGVQTDYSGRYAALYRPTHFVGLELGVSVATVALRGTATGAPLAFHADVVATAKRDLAAGQMLDGEGGYTVYGRLTDAADSIAQAALPIGLAHGVTLVNDVEAGETVRWTDVALDPSSEAVRARREMEEMARL
jgi:predicted homoserine dehydrogenase-like protein